MLITILIWVIALAVTLSVHEAAHAYIADRLGDPTARLAGRLTLNPIKHYDPVGTSLLIFLSVLRFLGASVIPFGWAKPVPIDPYNLKNPKKDSALISLAGPASNLFLSLVLSIILRVVHSTLAFNVLVPIIFLNVAIAIFNLIPVHPLDGGSILAGLMSDEDARDFEIFMRRYGFILLIIVIFPFGGSSLISQVLNPIINFILNILIPGVGTI